MSSLPYSDRPSAEEIVAAVPGLVAHGRAAVVFVPERGEPGVRESSVGGPLLWPAGEDWPCCSFADEQGGYGELEASAMVPVVQVFKNDAPGPWWPEGADVFQLLWCPNVHLDPPAPHEDAGPVVEVRWRRAADVGDVLVVPPAPVRQEDEEFGLSPRACTLTPVPLVDFPSTYELPDELVPEVERLIRNTGGDSKDVITRVGGFKLGGWPSWGITDPFECRCDTCGSVMPLLFTVASHDVAGITVGRWGDLRVFGCPVDLGHGYWFDVQ
ncbi:hypothetical protein ACGFMM_09295 [Streptomyces sp. NPDC048604]|uniref:hypothetical protein n=1 Tax=Streptomyces sp. NPDC048604 TaxID=3365578 RepID=UPI003720FBAB